MTEIRKGFLLKGEKIIQIVKGGTFHHGWPTNGNEEDIDCYEYLLLTDRGRMLTLDSIHDVTSDNIDYQYWEIPLPKIKE